MNRTRRNKKADAAVTALLDDILRILKRDGKTVGDLARELDRSYNQMYDWVVLRKFNPRATALMSLSYWKEQNKLAGIVPSRLETMKQAHAH